MNRNSLIALAALAVALLAVGCSSGYGTEAEAEDAPAVETDGLPDTDGDAETDSAEMTLASNAYVNDEGVALCPVLDNPISDLSTAAGPIEYEGKTYYFC